MELKKNYEFPLDLKFYNPLITYLSRIQWCVYIFNAHILKMNFKLLSNHQTVYI